MKRESYSQEESDKEWVKDGWYGVYVVIPCVKVERGDESQVDG